jgi:two-component system phosphate regulon sensor histidine kinase PhoR
MLGLGIFLSNFIRQAYLNDLDEQLAADALLIGEIIRPYLLAEASPTDMDILAKDWADRLGKRVTLLAADGTVLGESHEDVDQMDNHLDRTEIQQAIAHGKGTSTRYSRTLNEDMRYSAIAVIDHEKIIGFARVALSLKSIQETITSLQLTLVGAAVIFASLAILLALWITERTVQPLRELTQDAVQWSNAELESVHPAVHMSVQNTDEIGQLSRAFNVMAVELRSQIEALKSERSKMVAVLSAMTDGVLIVDSRGLVQLNNPASEAMFAVNGGELLGYSLAEVMRHHQLIELWQRCQETGEAQFTALEIAQNRLYLQVSAVPLGQALPGHTLLLLENLTRLRYLETIRQDFISNISHELRTPLASLKALTETLQDGALEDPPAAHRFLERMETEVDSLSLMVSELLELSRIESGRVPLKLYPAHPDELVLQAIDRLHLQAERSGLQVVANTDPDLPPVLADPTRLEQVLVNLLHNAIKFTPSGGVIQVGTELEGDRVLFTVRDTGIGITTDDLPRIFERFYKADRARSSGGTGLGLAIARHLVEAHGGQIWADSIEGKGSTFFFTIPVA